MQYHFEFWVGVKCCVYSSVYWRLFILVMLSLCVGFKCFMLYSRHLAYKHQTSTLNTFSISEGKFSTFPITLWLSTDSVWNLQFICQESVLSLAGLTCFTMNYHSYCLSGVTSIMTVGRIRGWLYSQPFCYLSPSPGTLVVCSIL